MNIERYMLPCMNKAIFGVDCPGCGLQRSLLMVCNGEFINAFHMFPAVYTTILFFASIGMNFIDKSRDYHKIIITLAIANGIIMLAAYLYKILNH
ncbi:DUF2752 domain-containing protein [Flavobacterium sp. 3HN19-14]|uniref:DUF2752 domain-containing protein n=1 Tax=Flavobacterium sp. 3HN19-14 TaxID=3448133 RepID=UPI003EDF2F88